MAKFDAHLKCSFCGKSQDQVRKLIAGPGVYICDECIDLCNEILDEELIDTQAKLNNSQKLKKKLPNNNPDKSVPLELNSIPKPLEIKTLLDNQVNTNNSPQVKKKLPTDSPKKSVPLELTSIPKPLEIKSFLDNQVVGQESAKKNTISCCL